ncbi:MAG: hypothetical protein IKD70_08270 [Eggerthellaceae bacterium]|nr:hypothetical protein [Eggerthellaceae bacterium]
MSATAAEPRTPHQGGSHIGIAAIFALVVILCMAVLATLAISTAHSSLVLSERQAAAVQEVYRAETAAQTFLSEVDGVLTAAGPGAVESYLPAICGTAQASTSGVAVFASMGTSNGSPAVLAQFETEGGRVLKVTLAIIGNTYRIDAWRMTAVVHDGEPMGTLYEGD